MYDVINEYEKIRGKIYQRSTGILYQFGLIFIFFIKIDQSLARKIIPYLYLISVHVPVLNISTCTIVHILNTDIKDIKYLYKIY